MKGKLIRPGTQGSKEHPVKVFRVPAAMGRGIPDDACFTAEFVDDGILFRFEGCYPRGSNLVPKHGEIVKPSWAEGSNP